MNQPSRRRFLKLGATTASFHILPSGLLHGQGTGPNDKLSVAFIGMGGQIQGHVRNILNQGHHVHAFCDVDPNQLARSKQRHGEPVAGVKTYADYRELFADGGFDAVVIATPDHWHAPLCKVAMKAGKHVYCEKPLTHTVGEARELRALARASKGVTQTGNQGSASSNLRRSMELIAADVFGPIREVHVWHPGHSWPSGERRPTGEDPVPAGMNWDFWCGPAPLRPYKDSIYHPAKWRGWYDFGNGALGDFCCHSFNLPLRALHLDHANEIHIRGDGLGLETFPKSCTVSYAFAPNEHRQHAVKLHFYTGGGPDIPPEYAVHAAKATFGNGQLPRVGAILIGDKGCLASGLWNSQCYVKMAGEERYLGAAKHEASKGIPQSIPRTRGHMHEWVDACLGKGTTFADFDHGGHLTEIGLAGIIALKLQRNINWQAGGKDIEPLLDKEGRDKWLA